MVAWRHQARSSGFGELDRQALLQDAQQASVLDGRPRSPRSLAEEGDDLLDHGDPPLGPG
jgi:hypothetical protein